MIAAGSQADDRQGCALSGPDPVTGAQAFYVRVINPNTIQPDQHAPPRPSPANDAPIDIAPEDATHVTSGGRQ